MTEITVYQCDGCGYEERYARPQIWQHIEDEALHESGLDFCESCVRELDEMEAETDG